MSIVKILSLVVAIFAFGWISSNVYLYFSSSLSPQVNVTPIEDGGCYAGDVQCIVRGSDRYKVNTISISLDGKFLVPNFNISRAFLRKKEFEYPFVIPTKALSNGKHQLKIEVVSGGYNKSKTTKKIDFIVDNVPLQAAFVKGDSDAKVFQGRTLHIQFQVNKPLKSATLNALSSTYPCFAESENSLVYECFIPIDCEQTPNEYLYTIDIVDRVGNPAVLENKFQVVPYPFKKQKLSMEVEKINNDNAGYLSEKQFETDVAAAFAKSEPQKLWKGLFYTPTEVREQRQITTEFGVMRTSQERGLRQHKALDIYNTPKSVIVAPQDGIVVIKNKYIHSGNTVVIDHGYGLFTLLFHLDTFAPIEVGDKIKKGNPVGTLGKSGYATGHHLHWEMRLNNIAVEPMQWTKQGF